jgi:hypothetical protein
MATLPTGTVTFLFTEIEGSHRAAPAPRDRRCAEVLPEHQRVLRASFEKRQRPGDRYPGRCIPGYVLLVIVPWRGNLSMNSRHDDLGLSVNGDGAIGGTEIRELIKC